MQLSLRIEHFSPLLSQGPKGEPGEGGRSHLVRLTHLPTGTNSGIPQQCYLYWKPAAHYTVCFYL